MKTQQIYISGNDEINACGSCFYEVASEDKYCSECGIEFDDVAYSYEDLKKFMDTQKEE